MRKNATYLRCKKFYTLIGLAYHLHSLVDHRIGLKLSGVDDEEPKSTIDLTFTPHLWSQSPKTVTVYHYADYPSHLLLPITKGNVVGTWISGGNIYLTPEEVRMLEPVFESARGHRPVK